MPPVSLKRISTLLILFLWITGITPITAASEYNLKEWIQERKERRQMRREQRKIKNKNKKNHREHILIHNDETRKYMVYTPSSYADTSAVPVVLNFHGGGANIDVAIKQTQMHETAEKHGFLVVYPEGTGHQIGRKIIATWNAGRCCGTAVKNNIDDVGFIHTLLDDLESHYNIDPKRIYATGHSNGALMSYRLACEMADRIAAIAPNSGQDSFNNCHPSRAIPIMHFHGTADQSAKYSGGHCGGRSGDEGWTCRAVPEYIDEWRAHNNCLSEAETIFEKGNAICVEYTQCRENANVVLCTLEGAGHTWPGGQYEVDLKEWKKAVGTINQDISANEMMWKFFEQHPLP